MNAQLDIASDTVVSAYHDVWHWQSMILCRMAHRGDSAAYRYISYVDLSTGTVRPLEINGQPDIQMVAEGQHSIAWISGVEDSLLHWTNTEDGWTRTITMPRSVMLSRAPARLLVSDSVVVIIMQVTVRAGSERYRVFALNRESHDWHELDQPRNSVLVHEDAMCLDDSTFYIIMRGFEIPPGVQMVRVTRDSLRWEPQTPFAAPSRLYRDAQGRIWGAGVEYHAMGMDWRNKVTAHNGSTIVPIVVDSGLGPFREALLRSGIDSASHVMKRAEINDVCVAGSTLCITIGGLGILGGRLPHPDSVIPTHTFSVALLPAELRSAYRSSGTPLRITDDFHGGLILSVWGKGLWWLRDLDTDPRYARLRDYLPERSMPERSP